MSTIKGSQFALQNTKHAMREYCGTSRAAKMWAIPQPQGEKSAGIPGKLKLFHPDPGFSAILARKLL